MKNKSILYTLLFALGLSVSFSSCEDMLTVDSDRNVYQTGQDTLYSYWGIMKSMQNIAERYVILGETRGDLIAPSFYVADSINDIAMFRNPQDRSCRYLNIKDYYSVINNCNCYLAWADTSRLVMNNQKMMLKEYAQVSAIRAWTYMQLVNNYGTVPFYTEPLTSLAFVDDFDFTQTGNRISRADIADKLVKQLLPMVDVAYPSYGNYETGLLSIGSKLTFLPLRVVIADLYLMQNQYEQAAQFYYDYFKAEEALLPTGYRGVVNSSTSFLTGITEYRYSPSFLMFSENQSASNSETVTVIPSTTNPRYGRMLTGIADLYGYTITTSVTSGGGEYDPDAEEDKGGTSESISILITRNYKKQLSPSEAFQSLGKTNMFCKEEVDKSLSYIPGDARLGYSKSLTNANDEEVNFVYKCNTPTEYVRFPVIYRKALIWLRFAEAINRAGFPSYAYAILKDGLCAEFIPEMPEIVVKTRDKIDPITGEPVLDEESGEIVQEEYEEEVYDSINHVCYYIPRSERKAAALKPYLDFDSPIFTSGSENSPTNVGIHTRGGGIMQSYLDNETRNNSLYDYKKQLHYKLVEANRGEDKVEDLSKQDFINLVEDLIVDELALETCFEGNRFPDLLRIASHRDMAGEAGNEWLADKIALRNFKLDTKACEEAKTLAEGEEIPEGETAFRYRGEEAYILEALNQKKVYRQSSSDYSNLKEVVKNRSNWYFPLPAHK
jgi:hypothetical protein